jgi:hypothetical protein
MFVALAWTIPCCERLCLVMLQVKSPGDMRNFEAEKAKPQEDTGYKSTGLFADF